MTSEKAVGYIGLGNIGKPSAAHLFKLDRPVVVFDLVEAAVAEMVELGARAASDLADIAASCDHIGICVRDGVQVESLLYGEAGLLAHAAPGTVIAIHSTVEQAEIEKWAADGAAHGVLVIDAPITGGSHGAEAAKLCYMVGADDETLARVTPIFETSAERIVHAGGVGTGIILKLCNNMMQYVEFTAMAEAAKMAEQCGLSVDLLREVGKSNGVVNEQMYMFAAGRKILAQGATEEMMQYFDAMGRLARKDLDCAIKTASAKGVVMPQANELREIIEDVFLGRGDYQP
jgi:3-hydroxyisobutyrate dehydrogenase